jgi:hypothetical protein
MKQLLFTCALFLSISAACQPFVSIIHGNTGSGGQLGWDAFKFTFTAQGKAPLTKADKPAIISLTVGKPFYLAGKFDSYIITPAAGIGHYSLSDFTLYDADASGHAPIVHLQGYRPMIALSLAKAAHVGQFFISAAHCYQMYYSVGVKAFFTKL